MTKIFYDCETTGLKPNQHSIVQLAGLIEVDEVIVERFDILMAPHPKAKLDPVALRINGRTEEEILAYPSMEEGLSRFLNLVGRYVDPYKKETRAHLVGYNNRRFDDEFLGKLFDLCKNGYFMAYFYGSTLDVLPLSAEYLLDRRASMPSFKLKRVALELGLVFGADGLHDAMFDAVLTRDIYRIVTGREVEI